jgi:hypothetical protein
MATNRSKTKRKSTSPIQEELASPSSKKPPKGIPLGELGTTGIKEFRGFIEQAYNRKLVWPEVYSEYSRLRRSMPEMGMVRQLFTVLGRGISPSIELPEKPSDDDKKYQEFIESEFDNMEGGFSSFIETVVSQVPFMGWGRWNVVPGLRDPNWRPPDKTDDWVSEEDDGLVGIRRLAWRDQGTLEKWEFNKHKRMIGMWQRDWPNPSLYLPNERCLHLTFGDPNNPEGLAPLEAIYRLERIRFGFEVIMGIGFEHAAGYIDVTKTEGSGTLTADDIQYIERAAMNILTAKEGNYAAWPPGIQGKIQDVSFQAATSLLGAIQHYNILALSVYLAQFIAFNTLAGTGSYASSTDSSQIAITAFNSMMDGFAAQIDRQIGRKWWDWNKDEFPGLTERPRLKFSHVQKNVDLGVLGQFIGQIKDTIPLGEQDLVAIRKRTEFLPETLPPEEEIVNMGGQQEGMESGVDPLAGEYGSISGIDISDEVPTMAEDIYAQKVGGVPSNATLAMRQALQMYSRNGKEKHG